MQKQIRLLLTILVTAASAFFVIGGNAEIAVAKPCEIGTFPDADGKCNPSWKSKGNGFGKREKDMGEFLGVFSASLIAVGFALGGVGIMFSGYQYITAGGDPKKIEIAKMWLIRTGVGVLILASSYLIFNLIRTILPLYGG